ncbi:hypothetical protein COX95_01725 [bacterium CG_4_10_14_0_2_um_filter_33_32]|nr:MAG: hypothetical protein AUJ93_01670 [bacterium CG2_30_33_46]PIR67841.1 MAG: hypothetical protein COU50_01245 [bacterium CG10_big_fil_rev_8_21_14_0_10_33_18]PIU76487.1 MAG: hypothetical protein COS74_03870 [bacterium CG06_land_8_20_14_3_00_33_50]PIW81361.1 MAG: hypothetical protein COZ97_02250 [bacterium CG_4_8_14_3_um_filter_33_28]PIY85191.1 MAG: hypothetical protein COY76_03500 [bacterium CG_4_10_14_0_8_um_filter_33_57]PIZ86315.1 MAG: hypothetical protein COX95_01725 [bacterium CG_4_10_1
MLSFSAIIFFIDALVWYIFSWKSWAIKKEEPKNSLIKHFFITFFILANAYFLFDVVIVIINENYQAAILLKIIADFILYTSFSYGIKIPVSIIFPKVNDDIPFAILFSLSMLATVLNVISPPHPFLSAIGIIHWNLTPIISFGIYVLCLGMWLPIAGMFFIEGKKDVIYRKRYWIMALGFLITSISGPISVTANSDYAAALTQFLMTIGHITILIGLLTKVREKSK